MLSLPWSWSTLLKPLLPCGLRRGEGLGVSLSGGLRILLTGLLSSWQLPFRAVFLSGLGAGVLIFPWAELTPSNTLQATGRVDSGEGWASVRY